MRGASGLGRSGVEQAEHVGLTALAIAARGAASLERDLDRGERGGARDAARHERRVECSALDERFEHALVDALGVDARREVEEIGERSAFLACLEERFERRLAETAHGAEAEADLRAARILRDRGAIAALAPLVARGMRVDHLEIDVALVDVRREHRDAHRAGVGDGADDLVDLLLVGGHDPAEQLDGVMRLEVRGLVRDERVGRRVRVVDDQPVGDEVVVDLDGEVEGLLDAARLDRHDAIPEDVGGGDVGETPRAEEVGELLDGGAAEAGLLRRALAQELLHRDAGLRVELEPGQTHAAALLVDPAADVGRDRVLARPAALRRCNVRTQERNGAVASHAVRSDAFEEGLDGALTDEMDRVSGADAAAILELLRVDAARNAEA